MPLAPGDPVRLESTKWTDRPHYAYDAVFLGSDEHGEWLGAAAGTAIGRPGNHWTTRVDFLLLVPAPGDDRERGWVARFYRSSSTHTYVDMATPPVWDGPVLRTVDLDLDVIRSSAGDVWVDDEDEFAEHRERYSYPPEIVALARQSATTVLDAVLAERAPFDGTAGRWFDVLDTVR